MAKSKGSRYRTVRETKAGRKVQEKIIRPTSALSGIGPWIRKAGVSREIARLDHKKYMVRTTIIYTYRFRGERRTYSGTLDVTSAGGDPRKRVKHKDVETWRKNAKHFPRMNRGAFDVYKTVVHDLIVGQNAYLGGYSKTIRKALRKRKGGPKYKREYARLEVGVVITRIERRKPRKGKK